MNAIFSAGRFGRDAETEYERAANDAGASTRLQRDAFASAYLPRAVSELFDEALRCYSADLFNAFALTCRQTLIASRIASGDADGEHARCAVREIVRLGRVEDEFAASIDRLLFGAEADIPAVDAALAGVLLEVIKDVLYESHIRAARFTAALKVRRFFADAQHEPHERRRRGR